MYKYPTQMLNEKRKEKALFVDDKLMTPRKEEYEENGGKKNILDIHSQFSRFEFSILDYEKSKSIKANIPPKDIPAIAAMTKIALEKILDYKPTDNSPAYTTQLLAGEFKGKTPANILCTDPSKRDALKKQRDFLDKNSAKFKANKKQVEAIDDALNLFDIGELKEAADPIIPIYDKDVKIPNAKKLDENGKTFIYGIWINCNLAMKYPFVIKIMNGKSKVKVENGQTTADLTTLSDKEEYEMSLDKETWIQWVDEFESSLKEFKAMNYPKVKAMADSEAEKNRKGES